MGLLTKAIFYQDKTPSFKEEKKVSHEFMSGGGLLKRATFYKESNQKRGLLYRAKNLRSNMDKAFDLYETVENLPQEEDVLTPSIQKQYSEENYSEEFGVVESNKETEAKLVTERNNDKKANEIHLEKLEEKLNLYRNIFDIIKEIQTTVTVSDFWDVISTAMICDLGIEHVTIFYNKSKKNKNFLYPIYVSNDKILKNKILKNKKLNTKRGVVKYLSKNGPVCPLNSLPISAYAFGEKKLFKDIECETLVKLGFSSSNIAVISIGPRVISNSTYAQRDTHFLELLFELCSIKLKQLESIEERMECTDWEVDCYPDLFHIASLVSSQVSLDIFFEALSIYLEKYLHCTSYSLVMFSSKEKKFFIYRANKLSKESQEKYEQNLKSEFLNKIQNNQSIYELENFDDNTEIQENYSAKDIKKISSYKILPFLYNGCLLAYLVLYEVQEEVSFELAQALSEICTPYFTKKIVASQETFVKDYKKEQILNKVKSFVDNNSSTLYHFVLLQIKNKKIIKSKISMEELHEKVEAFCEEGEDYFALGMYHFLFLIKEEGKREVKNRIQSFLETLPSKIPSISKRKEEKIYYKYLYKEVPDFSSTSPLLFVESLLEEIKI